MADRVKVGIIGSGFEADIHAASMGMVPNEIELVAVASPTPGHAAALAKRYNIPRVFTDYRKMLDEKDIEIVTITAPNSLHAQMTFDIAKAGKHVVCEKPLCMTMDEADEMIEVCRKKGVLLLYAEELFFTPKYVKAKEMADQGAFGKVYLVKQSEKHFGPHAEWFWDVRRSGGGVFMDMGCHGIAFCYWFLGRPKIKSILCHMATHVHADKTQGEDDSICILEFEGGAVGLIEDSWARRGGMQDRIEVYGEGGSTVADLHMGNALPTYSEYGYGYAVEKAPSTQGWSWPVFEELWNYGFPQEMRHFARCVRGKEQPQSTGEDGRVVQEILFAGYQSAGSGQKVKLPFRPPAGKLPIEMWKNPIMLSANSHGFLRSRSVIHDGLGTVFPDIRFEESDSDLDHAGDIDYIGRVGSRAFGIQIKPVTAQASFANYSPSERMKANFREFEERYGGKVFVVFSLDGEIGNPGVIDQIREEVLRLAKKG